MNPFRANPLLKGQRAPKLHAFRDGYHTVKEIAALTGLKGRTVYHRLKRKLPLEGQPRRGTAPRLIEFKGEQLTMAQIQERTGFSRSQVSKRTCGNRFIEPGAPEEANWKEPHYKARLLFHDCRSQSVSAWSRETGIPRNVITSRLGKGWSVERALTTPFRARFTLMLRYNGETMTIPRWAMRLGCSKETIINRISYKWPIERVLTEPPQPGRRKSVQSIAHTKQSSAGKKSGLIRIKRRRPTPGGMSELSALPRGPVRGVSRNIRKSKNEVLS